MHSIPSQDTTSRAQKVPLDSLADALVVEAIHTLDGHAKKSGENIVEMITSHNSGRIHNAQKRYAERCPITDCSQFYQAPGRNSRVFTIAQSVSSLPPRKGDC